MAVLVIAEAGVNHNGDVARALAMIDAAHAAGADAVKFQTFCAEHLVSPSARKAAYQARQTGAGNQFNMLKALELSEEEHRTLAAKAADLGIRFLSTPFDTAAVDFLVGLGMGTIKVPSGELTNHPFLRFVAGKGRNMIVSTGMATMAEVQDAVAVIAEARAANGQIDPLGEVLTLLHCTSSYPARIEDVHLRKMQTMAAATGLPVGYSDHSLSLVIPSAAVAMGASVIEKHFTLDRGLSGPDHKASLLPGELAQMVAMIREIEPALGSPVKEPVAAELEVREVARRSVALARDLPEGTLLAADDLVLLRPATGIPPRAIDALPGRALARSKTAGESLLWEDLR